MIYRTYECLDCRTTFEVACETNDGDPECPSCAKVLEWRPGGFNIRGNISKAADISQEILETDYGLTNWKDNTRAGEAVAMGKPPISTGELDRSMQQQSEIAQAAGIPLTPQQKDMASKFWGGGVPMQNMPRETLLPMAKQGAAEANAMGANPMDMLHSAGKKGQLPLNFRIIARG